MCGIQFSAGREHPCNMRRSVYENMVSGGRRLSCVTTRTIEAQREVRKLKKKNKILAAKGHSRRGRQKADETASEVFEQSRVK